MTKDIQASTVKLIMGCTNILAASLCFECKAKEWVERDKRYFCKRYDTPLSRVDGNSGGAVRTRQCACGEKPSSGKVPAKS